MGYYGYTKGGSYTSAYTLGTTGYAHYYYTPSGGISYSYGSSSYTGAYGTDYGSGSGAGSTYTSYGYGSSPSYQAYGSYS